MWFLGVGDIRNALYKFKAYAFGTVVLNVIYPVFWVVVPGSQGS